jgi:5'(3')-deoxyribonucleotidase
MPRSDLLRAYASFISRGLAMPAAIADKYDWLADYYDWIVEQWNVGAPLRGRSSRVFRRT